MKTELSVAVPFQSQFGWFSFGGRTKDLQCSVQNLLWNIFCDFSFILFLIFMQVERTFLVCHVHQKFAFLTHLIVYG